MAVLIKATGVATCVKPENHSAFTLKEMQEAVGGFIQILDLGSLIMVVNEDGLAKAFPTNEVATELVDPRHHSLAEDGIVGDVLICTRKEAGFHRS